MRLLGPREFRLQGGTGIILMIVASTARDTRDLASNICSCCNYLRRRHVRRVTGLLRIRGVTYGEEVACLRHDKGSSMQDGRAQIMLRQSCHDLGARRGKTSLNRTGQEDDTRSPRLRQRGQKANALPACNDRSRGEGQHWQRLRCSIPTHWASLVKTD